MLKDLFTTLKRMRNLSTSYISINTMQVLHYNYRYGKKQKAISSRQLWDRRARIYIHKYLCVFTHIYSRIIVEERRIRKYMKTVAIKINNKQRQHNVITLKKKCA